MSCLFLYLTVLESKVSRWKLICFFKCVLTGIWETSLPLCKDWRSWTSKLNSTFSIKSSLEYCVNIHPTWFIFTELWYKIKFTEQLQFSLCCSAAGLYCSISIALRFCYLPVHPKYQNNKSIKPFPNVSSSWW